jgi:L-2-hydroxyglutarate oxidase LhgO
LESTDVVIIGAGVVGLAIAAEIAGRYPDLQVIVMERNVQFGQETSCRNSEVIHSGIYYLKDSLKARLCVTGKDLLYRFCHEQGVPYKRLGKLIVAVSDDDLPSLQMLMERALANGVEDISYMEAREVSQLEPHIASKGALFSPSTGILDSHKLMKRLEWLALKDGAMMAYCHEARGIMPRGDGYIVEFTNPDGSADAISCSWLINCAGLGADRVASWMGIDVEKEGYRLYPCKGEYFSVNSSKAELARHLIYPPPHEELKGLGIHVTKTLDGRIRLGPSAFYVDKIDYSVDPGNAGDFYDSVKGFLPFLDFTDLEPEMAGIRPKLQGPGQPFRDFIIRHEADRGLKGIINLLGIESPGLTCCLSIAGMVADMICR